MTRNAGAGQVTETMAAFSDDVALGLVAGVMLAVAKRADGAMARDLALWSARLSLKAESLRADQARPGGQVRAAA